MIIESVILSLSGSGGFRLLSIASARRLMLPGPPPTVWGIGRSRRGGLDPSRTRCDDRSRLSSSRDMYDPSSPSSSSECSECSERSECRLGAPLR